MLDEPENLIDSPTKPVAFAVIVVTGVVAAGVVAPDVTAEKVPTP